MNILIAVLAWSVVGQTSLRTSIDNPRPNCMGLVGEVCDLPYQVPEGMELVLEGYSIEGYGGANVVIFPWITDSPVTGTPALRVVTALHSCLAGRGTQTCLVKFVIPEGKFVNIRLLPSIPAPAVHGWAVWGELIPRSQ